MVDRSSLDQQRHARWGQTASTRVLDSVQAARLIDRVGVATLFPVSLEIPNLFHAHMGDPAALVDSHHDSPSGTVYSWRWSLGHADSAFYSVLVRNRPTLVSWSLFPAILRLCGELRTPDDLYHAGELSHDAYRVAQALEFIWRDPHHRRATQSRQLPNWNRAAQVLS